MVVPKTQYTKNDGVDIAYQVIGDGPVDLAYVTGWSHLEFRWEHPRVAHFFNRLASFSRLIVFDRRGTGMSDPLPSGEGLSWEEWVGDLGVVLDAVGSERTGLVGFGEGSCMASLFAATRPERVTALMLINPTPRMVQDEDFPWGVHPEHVESMLDLWEQTWGTGSSPIVMTLAPDDPFREWWGKLERMCASPARARTFVRLMHAGDARAVLPLVQCPSLVVSRETVFRPVAQYTAEQIPGAKYVEVPGNDLLQFVGDTDAIVDEIEEFVTGVRPVPEPDRALATVLFTDIVSSTQRASELGDKRWKQVLTDHDAVVARELERQRGRLVKHTGDGVLATFDGPARAVRCAQAICATVRALGIEVRAGLHTGEIELRGDDIGGIAVHTGQRVSALAGPGEVLVSRTLTDLVAGSGLEFEPRGEHELKGLPGTVAVFAVRP
jgi:class 3 adenylate cyclase